MKWSLLTPEELYPGVRWVSRGRKVWRGTCPDCKGGGNDTLALFLASRWVVCNRCKLSHSPASWRVAHDGGQMRDAYKHFEAMAGIDSEGPSIRRTEAPAGPAPARTPMEAIERLVRSLNKQWDLDPLTLERLAALRVLASCYVPEMPASDMGADDDQVGDGESAGAPEHRPAKFPGSLEQG